MKNLKWTEKPGHALILVLFFLLSICLTAGLSAAETKKPNVVLILSDNLGYGDVGGAYGGGLIRGAPTPNIDTLAAQGMQFLNFNVETQCTPSRSALMTGRHPIRSGTYSIPLETSLYGLVPWEITLPKVLSEVGYTCGLFGKWHLGRTQGRFPTDQGFDVWYGIPDSTDESMWPEEKEAVNHRDRMPEFMHVMEGRKGEPSHNLELYDLKMRRLIDTELTRRAIGFMEASVKAGKPFFAYVPLTQTHYPSLPHPDFAGKTGAGDYADALVETDHHVGQIAKTIRRLGVEENTIFIYTSDNGPEDPKLGGGAGRKWCGSPGPWSGTYFTAMEGGIRVPFVVRWPGKIPAGRVSNEIVHIVDIFPTLARLTGARTPTDRAIDGMDQSDFLLGKQEQSNREGFLVYVNDELYAIKWHNFKSHRVWQETKYDTPQHFSIVPRVVDLMADPHEQYNVAEFYGWMQYMMGPMVKDFQESLKKYPPVPMGAPDDYRPGKVNAN